MKSRKLKGRIFLNGFKIEDSQQCSASHNGYFHIAMSIHFHRHPMRQEHISQQR